MKPRWRLAVALVSAAAFARAGRSAPARADRPEAAPPTSLSAEVAAEAGVDTAEASSAHAIDAVPGFGRVLDPAPFVHAWSARSIARRACDVAEAEERRVVALRRADHDASDREVEAARLALERARADLDDATLLVAGTWGADAAARADAAALASRLARGEGAIARIDLAPGVVAVAPATVLRVDAPTLGRSALGATWLGRAPTTDPSLQGEGWLVLLGPGPPPPGTALVAQLGGETSGATGVRIPASAIVWREGAPVVFVAASDGAFAARRISLGPSLASDAVLVTKGLAPGERVVIRGAQQLLSAQHLAATPAD